MKVLSHSEFIIIIDIYNLCFLYFFAWSLDLEAYQLYSSFYKKSFWLLTFSCYLFFISLISALYYFSLLTFTHILIVLSLAFYHGCLDHQLQTLLLYSKHTHRTCVFSMRIPLAECWRAPCFAFIIIHYRIFRNSPCDLFYSPWVL